MELSIGEFYVATPTLRAWHAILACFGEEDYGLLSSLHSLWREWIVTGGKDADGKTLPPKEFDEMPPAWRSHVISGVAGIMLKVPLAARAYCIGSLRRPDGGFVEDKPELDFLLDDVFAILNEQVRLKLFSGIAGTVKNFLQVAPWRTQESGGAPSGPAAS